MNPLNESYQLAVPFCFSEAPMDTAVTKKDCTDVKQEPFSACSPPEVSPSFSSVLTLLLCLYSYHPCLGI